MQSSLLNQLSKVASFSPQLITILQKIKKSLALKWSPSFLKQMQHHIVSLTCQNKNLLHYKYLQDKGNNEKCLTLILQILETQIKMNKQSKSHIVSLFLSHIFSHTSCYVSYSTFYLLVLSQPDLLQEVSHEKLLDINKKLEKQQNQNQLKELTNIKISESQVFNIKQLGYCEQNLNSFLSEKVKPTSNKTQKSIVSNLNLSKIPPLILPTSKSINSSRYSALSKEQKKKGILDLRKLASHLGEGFICVELGCLLSNKRTQQVQQFSENYSFRQRCLEKLDQIETQRMNSSRLSFSKEEFYQKQPEIQENSRRYYRKVLVLNLNLIMKKIQKMESIQISIIKKHKGFNHNELKQREYLKQIIDMSLLGIIHLPGTKSFSEKQNSIKSNEDSNIFSCVKRQIKDIDFVVEWLMKRISSESEKIHLNLLYNKNKAESSYHFDTESQEVLINDCMLDHITVTRNQAKKVKGSWKLDEKNIYEIKKQSDSVILHVGGWLQSLFKSSNLDHPKFIFYEINLLKTLNFYLSTCQSKVTPYIVIEFLFPILIMIKRQITELSHPYIENPEYEYTNRTKQVPIIFSNKALMQNYLDILSSILVNNKYVEKLFCNVFLKNIYFMELVQHYLECMFVQENYQQIISVLKFYTKILDTFNQRKNKQNESIMRNIMQQISSFMCPNNGCISKALFKYQNVLSPSQLDDEQRSDFPNPIYNFLHETFVFISHMYYLSEPEIQSNSILDEEVASFYIKYAFMNYIKLYSLMTVKELVNINSTSDDMMTTKQSPHSLPKISSKKVFMIDFLKMLTNISINRSSTVSKKFLQYRVLEFFVRELELQFSVIENIEKYIKKAVGIKDVPQQKSKTMPPQRLQTFENAKSSPKKPKVTALNLTGQFFKKQQKKQETKKFNSTHQPKGKKLVPPLNIPLKTQEREKSNSKDRSSGDRKKGQLDDILSKITEKQKKKKSFVGDLNLQLSQLKNKDEKSKRKDSSEKGLIYSTERKIRKIYSNKALHSQSILLVFSLLLIRGQLDPLYCDQFPIDQGKMNVLYILHYHLNHLSNKSIIPILSEGVTKIKPYLAGQRLLKLLYNSFTDLKYYENWSKINTGGYGVIYSATTQLYDPKEVAIKEMSFPKTISNRCVLHNIFTQISSLQLFRLDNSVTRMYNYGVVDNTYFIIMKKYTCSLRDWRQGNKISPLMDSFPVNLPNILSLYYDILKVVKLLHDQNVIHYDIKADNIMLQIVPSQNQFDKPFIQVAFGDFGQAKIFNNQSDELDLKSRGTQCIKSPEMLTLALKNKKEADNYDRRKKIGTTRASDIWSLGCLLYEMITGQYLFHRSDWANFYMHVISPNEELLTPENYQKMNNNIYLIDFLKYILIRDPSHRPSIHNIINRFENLYSLLVNNEQKVTQSLSIQYLQNTQNIIKEYIQLINLPEKRKLKTQSQYEKSIDRTHRSTSLKMLKIMEDIYFSENAIEEEKLKDENITHIVTADHLSKYKNFNVFFIDFRQEHPQNVAYKLCPRVSDFLREVLLLKGKLLFINNETNYAINLLVFTLSYWFRCSAYETWCLINTQLLSFPTFTFDLVRMSKMLNRLNLIQKQFQRFPKLQCICGSVTIMMKKCPDKKNDYQICKCKKKSQIGNCSSSGCAKYVQLLKKRYNISWQYLKWALINPSYLITPIKSNNKQQSIRTQILLNSAQPISNMVSMHIDANGWTLYECKMCEMWIMATRNNEIRIILNNLIKAVRQGIMIPNAQQGFKARTPSLNYYTLSKLHMTSQ